MSGVGDAGHVRGTTRRPSSLGAAAATYIDLGSEPALAVSTGARSFGVPGRRAVSMRWLSGTILTGFTSLFLMGGALLAALHGQNLLAMAPQPVDMALFSTIPANGQKGDRIIPEPAPIAAREILEVTTIVRRDDRDIIQQQPFVRITAVLATARGDGVAIPAYDPVAIAGEAATGTPEGAAAEPVQPAGGQIYAAEVDGEVAVQTAAFPLAIATFVDHGLAVTTAEVEALVRATATGLPLGAMEAMPLAYATPAEFGQNTLLDAPIVNQGVRITPQNVSFVTRTDGGGLSRDERLLAIQSGQPLPELLMANGMAELDARDAVAAMEILIDLTQLTASHRVRLAFEPSLVPGVAARPLRVSIYLDGAHQATVARSDEGVFVRADEPPPLPAGIEDALPVVTASQSRTLYEAIYLTALENEVPASLINQLVRIFAFDLDMQSRIGPRDSIEIFHRLPDGDTAEAADEGIIFAAVTLAGVTKRYYRFQNPADGTVDYYDADGRSANIFLLRKPMSTGEYRSGFGMRRHPILGTYTMHTGIDWAAPSGTPIVAAGDGVVVSAGWVSGYGNYTRIRHANGYETAYAHQRRFAPTTEVGATVTQGQVIGYVGSTGLSTGPHLHYEVRINGQLVDPLRIRLPRGDVLEGEVLAAFQAQRHEIATTLGITDEPATTDVAAAPAAN